MSTISLFGHATDDLQKVYFKTDLPIEHRLCQVLLSAYGEESPQKHESAS